MIEVIAEIGVNHNGSLNTACRLIDAAIEAGANVVKTQLWNTERVYPPERWYEMKQLELSRADIETLNAYCFESGIELIVTPDEIEDAIFLRDIGLKRIKTSSQDVTNIKFLKQVAALGLPVIFSTGACDWDEVSHAVCNAGFRLPLTILHCVSAYPAPLEQMNMLVLDRLREFVSGITSLGQIGLSDHTLGNEAAIMALAMGATVFEKHLTLSRNQEGPDHAASLTPPEMWQYIQTLRECEMALGDGDKRVMPCEVESRQRFEKFIAKRL